MNKVLLAFLLVFTGLNAGAQTCSIVSADIVCKEELMGFDVKGSAGIQSVIWDLGDATTSTQKSFNHKYSSTGIKTVKGIITLTGGGSCTATKQITVFELPKFNINLKPDNIYCLSKNKVCFIDSSKGGDPGVGIRKRIILWDDGSQNVVDNPPTGQIVCHTYTNTGIFKVTIELTNQKDCKVKKEVDIEIVMDITPKIKVVSIQGCDSSKAEFKDVSTSKDTTNILSRIYDWGDGKTTTTKSTEVHHYYKKAGFYKVSLTYVQKNGCRTSKDTLIEITIPEIKFNITKDGYRKCYGKMFRFDQNDLLPDASYDWFIGSKQYEGKTIEIAPPLGKHKFYLVITYKGCIKVSQVDSIEVVGISPTIIVLNTNQCSNKDTVFFCEKDIRYGLKKVTFFWDFGDDMAPGCTTSFKTGTNVKNNCNYSTDSIGKHYYVNGVCRRWNLTIKDHEYGCDYTDNGVINVVKPDTFYFDHLVNRKCLGLKPDYKIRFSSSLCSIIDIKTNYDSACGRDKFVAFAPEYAYQKTCNPKGWVTVGFAIKYGNKKVYRTYCDTSDYYIDPSRECFDTIWFHNWYKLSDEPFPPFEASGKCIPATVTPDILAKNQKDIKFSTWDWGDNTKTDTLIMPPGDSIIKEPSHIYKKAGAYNIRFYIEDHNRCYSTYNQLIVLGFDMKMNFDTVICPGLKVKFSEQIFYLYNPTDFWHNTDRRKKGKELFKWNFDDGRGFVTDTASPSVKFPTKGIYKIQLAAKDSSNCLDTLTKYIKVGGVNAGIKAITKKIICDDIIQFFDSSYSDFKPPADSIVSHYWSFGDYRNPSYLKNPFHFYKSFGDYTIFHRVENTKGCQDSTSVKIKIEGPLPKFDIVSDTVGCAPFTAEFKNTSIKTKDYIWFFGDPLKSVLSTTRDTNVRFTYTKPGIYYIYLYGNDSVINPNAGGAIYFCKSTFPDTAQLNHPVRRIVVLPIPKVDFEVDPVQCKDKPFVVIDKSDSIYTRHKWVIHKIDSTITSLKTGILNSKKDTGTFTIHYTPTYTPNGPYQRKCYDTTEKQIRITDIKAKLDFEKDPFCPIYTFTNNSIGSETFKWNLNHEAVGEENNVIYNQKVVTHNYVPDKGRFYPCLFVESKYGCRDTMCVEFDVDFSIKAIIPNVFTPGSLDNLNDAFDIVMENVEQYDLSIYSRWGQMVYHSKADGVGNDGINWNGKNNMTGEKCPEGTYFYLFRYKFNCQDKIHNGHGTITLIRSAP